MKHAEFLFTSAGPAELAAAALLAKRGRTVLVLEPSASPGGWAGSITVDGHRFPRLLAAATGFEPDMPMGLLLSELLVGAPVMELEGEVCLHGNNGPLVLEDIAGQAHDVDQTCGAGMADFLLQAQEAWFPAWQAVLSGNEPQGPPARDIFRGSPQAWGWLDGLSRILAGAPLDGSSLAIASLALEALWRPLYLPQGDLMEKLAGAVGFYQGEVCPGQSVLSVNSEGEGLVQTSAGTLRAGRLVEFGTGRSSATAVHYLACEDVFDPEERLWHIAAHHAGFLLLQVLPGEGGGPRKLVIVQPLAGGAPLTREQLLGFVWKILPDFSSKALLACRTETYGVDVPRGENPSPGRLPGTLPLAVERGRRRAFQLLV